MRILFEINRKSTSYAGFELGHVIFEGPLATVSSRDCLPPQSMMVFTSATSLMDTVRGIHLRKSAKQFEWIGDDPSFRVVFTKTKDHQIMVQAMNNKVAEVSLPDLFKAVNSSVSALVAGDGMLLEQNSAAWADLQAAHASFRRAMTQRD
jgi:hypothetical protein